MLGKLVSAMVIVSGIVSHVESMIAATQAGIDREVKKVLEHLGILQEETKEQAQKALEFVVAHLPEKLPEDGCPITRSYLETQRLVDIYNKLPPQVQRHVNAVGVLATLSGIAENAGVASINVIKADALKDDEAPTEESEQTEVAATPSYDPCTGQQH